MRVRLHPAAGTKTFSCWNIVQPQCLAEPPLAITVGALPIAEWKLHENAGAMMVEYKMSHTVTDLA